MNDETDRYHPLRDLRFLLTPEHECGYLAEQEAVTLFVDPQCELTPSSYSLLAEIGFRRSGEHLYRPHCPQCKACIPVRIPVERFVASRNQRRVLARNNDLHVRWSSARYHEEHFALYRRYMQSRHTGSSMDDDNPTYYRRLLDTDWCETRLAEIRQGTQLFGVAITDWLENGLSAVYTFFDPDAASRSLGTYAILRQVQTARQHEMRYVYLGYWIKSCAKMAYKDRFRPFEYFDGHRWHIDKQD
ncbi:MAG: arginyltransferase [Gammaproteobacteria bacterium]|nr:arginyltransferase [Gammaproteobacteria bacterium]